MDLSSMLNDSVPKATVHTTAATSGNNNLPPSNTTTIEASNNSTNANYNYNQGRLSISQMSSNNTNQRTASISSSTSSKEKTMVYQLSTSLHYLLAKDTSNSSKQQSIPNNTNAQQAPPPPPLPSNNYIPPQSNSNLLSSPFRNTTEEITHNIPTTSTTNNPSCLRLGTAVSHNPKLWKPRLSLRLVMKEQPMTLRPSKRTKLSKEAEDTSNALEVPLIPHEVIIRGDEPKVLLEDVYEIQGAYPRGFFVMMAKRNIQHSFVFTYPDHPWFEDLYGLRKSAYVGMRTEEGELYELHLKPSRDKMFLFGYMIKHVDMIRIVKESMNELLYHRKLPLVLDLDDTLVRLVGEGNERYVKEADIPKCKDRVAILKDNRRVVLTDRVHEFLDWAQNFYVISVCSLGDQNYVENVVKVLDPHGTRIRGILYSARNEHDYIKKSPDPSRPPKDLLALYSFCALKDRSIGSAFTLPLILDDETRMWPQEQHDNIIEVTHDRSAPCWSVSLFPVVKDTLEWVHQEFFRQFDNWYARCQEAEQFGTVCTKLPPSAVDIYKTYLRHILRDMIAKGRPPPVNSGAFNHRPN